MTNPQDPRPDPAADASPTEAYVPPPASSLPAGGPSTPWAPPDASTPSTTLHASNPWTPPDPSGAVAGAPPAAWPSSMPSGAWSGVSAPSSPGGAPPAFVPPPMAFAPAEPGPGDAFTVPAARARRESSGGASRLLNLALGAAILVGAVGIAFAVGRATGPGAGANPVADDGGRGIGDPNGNGGANGGPGAAPNGNNGNGNGNGNGGRVPGSSFDLNGNGGVGPGDDPDNGAGFDRGFGRGFGGLGITGTVTEVAADHVTVRLANGATVTIGLDGTTTYHQQAPASQSDVKTGSTVQVQLGGNGRIRPQRDANGNITLGTAGDITVLP